MRGKSLAALVAALALVTPLSACSPPRVASDVGDLLDDPSALLGQSWDGLADDDDHSDTGSDIDDGASSSSSSTEWSLEDYPDYYRVDGEADFTGVTIPDEGQIVYGTPDSLNRSTQAIGVITYGLMEEGSDRERDMPDEITGWPDDNPEVEIDLGDGDAYHGYLFNRSHLIAKSLGGEDSAENMITGTRTENVGRNQPPGGMAYTETLARDWLDENPDGTVTYMATPVYEGNELLPRTVEVDILTSDNSINQHVIVYNTANGYDIDYENGGVL